MLFSVNQIRLYVTSTRFITGDVPLITDVGQVSARYGYSFFFVYFLGGGFNWRAVKTAMVVGGDIFRLCRYSVSL